MRRLEEHVRIKRDSNMKDFQGVTWPTIMISMKSRNIALSFDIGYKGI